VRFHQRGMRDLAAKRTCDRAKSRSGARVRCGSRQSTQLDGSKGGEPVPAIECRHASDEVRTWIQYKDLLEHGPGWAKLTRSAPLGSLKPPGNLRTRRVQVDEAPIFGSMMCKGFDFPQTLASLWSSIVGKEGWSCFFALHGETLSELAPCTRPGRTRG